MIPQRIVIVFAVVLGAFAGVLAYIISLTEEIDSTMGFVFFISFCGAVTSGVIASFTISEHMRRNWEVAKSEDVPSTDDSK